MSPEAQRIALAEACGWRVLDVPYLEGEFACYATDKDGQYWPGIPDYPNDLNAMHEAEKVLTEAEDFAYRVNLENATNFKCHRATAAQRTEAFLRTLGKWEEATKETTK